MGLEEAALSRISELNNTIADVEQDVAELQGIGVDISALTVNNVASGSEFYRTLSKPMFTFILDDAESHVYTAYTTYFKPNSIPLVTAYCLNLFPTDEITIANMKEIIADGGEILSHGYSGVTLTSAILEEVDKTEIEYSKMAMEQMGIEVNGYLPPGGTIDVAKIPKIKKVYSYALCNYQTGLVSTSKDYYNLNRVDAQDNLTVVKQWIDSAYTNNGWLIMYSHGINTIPAHTSEADLLEIFAYIASKGDCDWVSIKSGIEKIGTLTSKENVYNSLKRELNSSESNLIGNPHFATYGSTGSTVPVAWTLDASHLNGTYTQTTKRSNVQGKYSFSFVADGNANDYITLTQDIFIGYVERKTSGFFAIHCKLTACTIDVTVKLYTSAGYISDVLALNNVTTSKDIILSQYFDLISDVSTSYLKVEIKLTRPGTGAASASIYAPLLKIYNNPLCSTNPVTDIIHAYATNDTTLSNSASSVTNVNIDAYTHKTIDINVSTNVITAVRSGLYECLVDATLLGTYTGTLKLQIVCSTGVTREREFTVATTGTNTVGLYMLTYVDLKKGETATLKVWKSATGSPLIKAGSCITMKLVS